MKDPRYKAIKSLIETKTISSLKDVFTIIPLSVVKTDIPIHYNTLRSRVGNSDSLTMRDVIALAKLFEVEPIEVFRLALYDINSKIKTKKK